MDMEAATNPVEGEDTAAATLPENTEVEAEGQTTEAEQFDEDGNPIEGPPEDEEVEVEDGLKLKVPKDHAQKVREALLRQADYTRKTQEVAEQRRAMESERQAIAQSTQEELNAFAQAKAIEPRLAEYQRLTQADWDSWEYNDPDAAQRGFREYTLLKDQYAQTTGALSFMRQQRALVAQHTLAKRSEEGRAVLAREIGWNDELKSNLVSLAEEFGFSRDDLDDIEADTRVAKLLYELKLGREARAKQQQAQRHVQAQQVTPAAKVSAQAAPTTGVDDRTGIDAWMARRNSQVRKRA